MSFVPSQVISSLQSLSPSSADSQPFGIVQVDDNGNITLYNKWEADLAGIAQASAHGKNFFTQIAPCTNNRLVHGKFKDGVAKGDMDSEFGYTFTYKMKPTNVTLRLYRHQASGTNWVFVGKKAA